TCSRACRRSCSTRATSTGSPRRSRTCSRRRSGSRAPRSASPRVPPSVSSGDVAGPAHGAGQAADLDPQVVALLERLRAVGAPPVQEQTPAELRQRLAATAAVLFGTVDEVASVEDRLAGGVRVRVYEPRPGDAALVYYHGGGWVAGSVDTHDGIVRALAARSGRTVVSVDYRLAPEHPYPAGLEDARTAARWALDPFDAVAVGGDSSGATLAAVVARELPVALQLLICPALDARCETDSYARFAEGTNLTREAMRWYWAQYLGGADGDDPDASPRRPRSSPWRSAIPCATTGSRTRSGCGPRAFPSRFVATRAWCTTSFASRPRSTARRRRSTSWRRSWGRGSASAGASGACRARAGATHAAGAAAAAAAGGWPARASLPAPGPPRGTPAARWRRAVRAPAAPCADRDSCRRAAS